MTAPLDLDALEAAARAAGTDCWYEARDAKLGFETEIEEDIPYIIAASPAVVLALIERLRAADVMLEEIAQDAEREIGQMGQTTVDPSRIRDLLEAPHAHS